MILKNKKILFSTIATMTILFALSLVFVKNCNQIHVFKGDAVGYIVFNILKLGLAVGIWILGFFLFKKLNIKEKYTNTYFVLLTIVAMHSIVKDTLGACFTNKNQIVESICTKSADDGMKAVFTGITREEYAFLRNNQYSFKQFPTIPIQADSINIDYYRDDFSGNYELCIRMQLPKGIQLDTIIFPYWKLQTEQNFTRNKYFLCTGSM